MQQTFCALLLLTALSGSLLLTACGKQQEVSYKSSGVTQTLAEGQGSIPADFSLPIYPQSTPTGSVSAQGQKGKDDSTFLILSSADPVQKVSDYYQRQLKAGGWKLQNQQDSPDLVSLSVSKDDQDASVTISANEDKKSTTISLAVSRLDDSQTTPDNESFSLNKLTPPTD